MSPDRRQFLRIAGAAGVTGVAGCTSGGGGGDGESGGSNGSGGNTSGGGNGSGGGGSGGSGGSGSNANVGMVYAKGGLGDKSFNDMAHRGVERAKQELGVSYNEAQPEQNSDFPTFQRRYAQSTSPSYDLVSCIGFAQVSALTDVAPNFPDQKFMLVDGVVEESNVANYVFKEEQGSFQIGHLAGLLTTEKLSAGGGKTNPENAKLGFVGGEEAPLIQKFQAGFEKGAKYANKDASVNVAYTGSFADPGAGKEAALSMYNDGADIVYHAAGATGIGVFQAASEQNRYALGVDADQSKSQPKFANVILASMVKQVDNAVFSSIESVVNGNFEGGGTKTLGLEKDGVEVVYGKQLGSAIPKEVKQALKESRKKIISGEISVPQKPGSGK